MKSAAERRELIVHIDDNANSCGGKKVENRRHTLILIHQAMAITDGIDTHDKVKGSEERIFGESERRRCVSNEIFVPGHAKPYFFVLLRWEVFVCFEVGRFDEGFRKVRT